MSSRIICFLVLLASSPTVSLQIVAGEEKEPELSIDTLDEWLLYLRPKKKELDWESLGWRPRYWEGLVEAQRTQKPVLLWAMNGHPLGCT